MNKSKKMKIRYEFNEDTVQILRLNEIMKEIDDSFKEESKDKNKRVFGNTFVKNNKNKCKIIVNGHLEELKEFINNKYINNKNLVKIKLISLENIDDLSEMFLNCQYLTKIYYFDKLKIKNITNIKRMFYNCESLKELPDCISKWNINNVKDISEIFCGCNSLNKLPDISRWNTINDSL